MSKTHFVSIIFLLFLIKTIHSLTINVIDPNGEPIPFVVVQSEIQTVVSDSLGVVRLDISPTAAEETISFSRLGYKTTQKTIDELLHSPTVTLQMSPIITDEFIVKAASTHSPFRMTSTARKVEISDLNRSYASIDDIIKDVQDINVRGVRLAGERQTISLGGHQSRHTIIMLDHIVLNPSGQAIDLSSIPFSEIESIEIVKNNVSVETGSGGIAGMIILHSKRNNRQNQINFSNSVGSFGSIKQNAGFHLWLGDFGVSFNTSWLAAKNDFEYTYRDETQRRQYNQKSMVNISTDLRYQIDRHDIAYNLRYQRFHNQLPGPVNQEMVYLKAFQEGDTIHHSLFYHTRADIFAYPMSFEAQAYQIDTNSTYNNTQAPIAFHHALNENIQRLQGVKSGARQEFLFRDFELASNIGGEYKKESFQTINHLSQTTNDALSSTQETTSFFVSQAISRDLPLWTPQLIGSYRTDHNSEFSFHHSWRAEFNNAIYAFVPFLRKELYIPFLLNSSIGTSYTLPSFFELYWQGDSQTQGNPDLVPERSFGYRIEGILDTNPSLGAAFWQNNSDDLIYWNRSVLGWKPFNLQTAEIRNWEVFGNYSFLKEQSLSFSYTRTIARDKSKNPDGSNSDRYDKFLVWTPSYYCDIQLNLKAKSFTQNITFAAQGKQWTTPDQLIPPLKGYETWHTRSSIDFKLGEVKTSLSLFIYNLFDKRYENYPYLPEPGRHWEMQVSFRI